MPEEITNRKRNEPAPAPLSATEALAAASDPALGEDAALALLKRADLLPEVLEQLARNAGAIKSRKVKIGLACHPNTPRHISIPLARQFYTFELMKAALSPLVPADVKLAMEDLLIARLKSVTAGERLTLARRASGRVAAELLLDLDGTAKSGKGAADSKTPHARVMQIALQNARLTEALVVRAVLRRESHAALVRAVAQHAKWSQRKEVRLALLRSEYLSLARALEFSRELDAEQLAELLASSALPEKIKRQLLQQAERGESAKGKG